jgi:hypothetical protein
MMSNVEAKVVVITVTSSRMGAGTKTMDRPHDYEETGV